MGGLPTVEAKVVDSSWKDLDREDLAEILGLSPELGHIHDSFIDRGGRHWRLVVRRIGRARHRSSRRIGMRTARVPRSATRRSRHGQATAMRR